jgi:hypothetical protein
MRIADHIVKATVKPHMYSKVLYQVTKIFSERHHRFIVSRLSTWLLYSVRTITIYTFVPSTSFVDHDHDLDLEFRSRFRLQLDFKCAFREREESP